MHLATRLLRTAHIPLWLSISLPVLMIGGGILSHSCTAKNILANAVAVGESCRPKTVPQVLGITSEQQKITDQIAFLEDKIEGLEREAISDTAQNTQQIEAIQQEQKN